MKTNIITAVGIDVSKAKSTVAARRPGGEVALVPFDVAHDMNGLRKLVATLNELDGEVRIVMEHTGMYWRPVAFALREAGFFVSVVNAMLIHDFSDNSLRKVKTDRADALKIANYGLTYWSELREYSVEDETRQLLKIQSRLYERTTTTGVMLRNGLISLLDQTFPGANKLFRNEHKNQKGHVKWVDFIIRFWHKECVAALPLHSFTDAFHKWCKRAGYRFSASDAERIHTIARNAVATLPKNDSTKLLITQSANSLNAVYDSLQMLRNEMNRLASLLPEYELVMSMEGVGQTTGPQLMAEIGDISRFSHKGALVAYAGVDAPPFQSGTFDAKNRHVSKRGSPHLRKVLFEIASMILVHGNMDNPIFRFMDKKRAEGKHFYVYTVAGSAKFLRIYYAKVREYLSAKKAA
jgi:transposase